MIFKRLSLLSIVLILSVLSTRVLLFNKDGLYFYLDEIRYKRLIITLSLAKKSNDLMVYVQSIYAINARPGYAIFYSLPVWLEQEYPNIPFGQIVNIIVNNLFILLIYLTVKKVANNKAAAIAVLFLIFSISSVIYIRHMLPYDIALMILILALYINLKTNSNYLFGLLVGLSFLTYPSYFYYLISIPLILLFYGRQKDRKVNEVKLLRQLADKLPAALLIKRAKKFISKNLRIKSFLLFVTGSITILILAHIFSIMINTSPYFQTLKDTSSDINQGDYMPALSFITEYILAYDGYWGIILVFCCILVIFLKNKNKFLPLIIYILITFSILEFFSHIYPKTVLYGRTVRPLYILLLILAAIVIEALIRQYFRKRLIFSNVVLSLIFIITIFNWWPKFLTFKDITYPSGFRKKAEDYLTIRYDKYKLEELYPKMTSEMDSNPEYLDSGKFYLVNTILLYPYFGTKDLICQKQMLLEEKHILSIFQPYQFEGFTKTMRGYLNQRPPKYQLVYCKTS